MNGILVINLIIDPNCILNAIDDTNYLGQRIDLSQYILVDFIKYNDDLSITTENIREQTHSRDYLTHIFTSKFILDKDGTYSYYKFVIPKLDKFKTESGYIGLNNQLFYYNNNFYYCSNIINENVYNLDDIINNSKIIVNHLEFKDFIQQNVASQTLYCPEKKLFSICKLQKCLVNLQKQLLFNTSNCSLDKCSTREDIRNTRDFLMGAMYVFDYLKDIQNYTEAQRILDNMISCSNICDNILEDCNCGNSL